MISGLTIFFFFNLSVSVVGFYNVVLVSGVQQSDSVIYMYTHTCVCVFFSDSFPLQVITGY